MRFSVWAPAAARVQLLVDGRRLDMQRDGELWCAEAPGAGPGSRYGFYVDGDGPLPDPCSRHQPDGVHGLSAVVDVAALRRARPARAPAPLSRAVLYELHVGTFTEAGTFEGAIERLDHLVALGVTHVELMPVATFPGQRGWGYDGVALSAPHAAYGGPEALARLVDACHARGLAVILDVVYNHLGPTGNYLGRLGPYFTQAYQTPWGQAVNLDGPGSDGVRRFFLENARLWLEDYGFDGLRLDAVHALFDRSAVPFLEELARYVDALEARLGRPLVLIAESDLNDPRIVRPLEAHGHGVDAQWSDDLHHALHAALTGERSGYYEDFGTLAQLAKALEQAFVYDGQPSPHRRRRHGRPPDGLEPERFLAYGQTHDQVGNRARGERLCHLVSPPLAKIAACLVLTSRFVPMLFQGEEWAASSPFQYFTDHEDAGLAAAVTAGRREEFAAFGWKPEDVPDPQAPETFRRSKLDWRELDRPPHADVLAWYRRLIELRTRLRRAGALRGRPEVTWSEAERWIRVRYDALEVLANLAPAPRRLPVAGDRAILLGSGGARFERGHLVLEGESAAILGAA